MNRERRGPEKGNITYLHIGSPSALIMRSRHRLCCITMFLCTEIK